MKKNKMTRLFIICSIFFLISFAGMIMSYAETYEYDALGRVKKALREDGSSVTYTYDANGNLESHTAYDKGDKNVPAEAGDSKDQGSSDASDTKEDENPSTDANGGTKSGGDANGRATSGETKKPDTEKNTDSGQKDTTSEDKSSSGSDKSNGRTVDQNLKGKKIKTKTLRYQITKAGSEHTVKVLEPVKKQVKSITIPGTIKYQGKTYQVTEIASGAFQKQSKLKKVTIGKNIEKIGKKAFYNCKNLKRVKIKSGLLKSVGKKAFTGTNKKLVIKVPSRKLKAYRKLLANKGMKKTAKVKK